MQRQFLARLAEKRLFDRKLSEVHRSLPGGVARDENNILSLQEVVGIGDAEVVSFDFFDTLFFREHLSLGQVMEKTAQLGAGLVPGDRDTAQRLLYGARGHTSGMLKKQMQRARKGDEPRLRDIFARALAPIVEDPQERAQLGAQIEAIECAIERRNLKPNAVAANVLTDLRLTGRQIYVTSDMYLPADALAAVLDDHGLLRFFDDVIVSSEYGITKHSGDLFEVLIKQSGVAPERILHVGDNWVNDVVRPRENGLIARHYHNAGREREAARMDRQHGLLPPRAVRDDTRRTAFAAAAPAAMPSLDAIVDQVMGPAAALFMHEVLTRAAREGSSDIFFLTRDGTIFKEIADAMVAAAPELYDHGATHKVLACSRVTGVLLGFDGRSADYLYANTEYLGEGSFSFERFKAIFRIPEAGIVTMTRRARDHLDWLGDAMTLDGFRSLWEYESFAAMVRYTVKQERAQLVDYLEATGLFAAHRPLLVDIGYSGTWGKQITPVLEERELAGRPVPDMSFEFFATNRFYPDNVRQMHPSLTMGPGRILDHREQRFLTAALNYSWLEPFFLDPLLGKFLGVDDALRPCFGPSKLSECEQARTQKLRRKLVARASRLAQDLLTHEADPRELKRDVQNRLCRLASHPRRAEAKAINTMTHERGMNAIQRQDISLSFYPNNLRAKIDLLMAHDHWVQGSLALSRMGILNHALDWYYARTRPDPVDWRP